MRLPLLRASGVLSCILFASAAPAQLYPLWIEQFGTELFDFAHALAPDGTGGVFIAGATDGSLGGPSAGASDAYIARWDDAGNLGWIAQFGTESVEYASALATDGSGGVFVAGHTKGALGGPNAGGYDAFLARYDDAGNQVWITQIGTSGYDFVHALAPDDAGGVIMVGYTEGSLGGPNAGSWDIFLARYNGGGDQAWITQFGTSNSEYDKALASDGSGGVFIAGITAGNLGGPNEGYTDVFLARYDSAGEQVWITQFGSDTYDYSYSLLPDGTDGVFVAGATGGSLSCPSEGGYDAYLARHDAAGNQIWITQFGTADGDYATALATDGKGLFVAGSTGGSLGGPNAGDQDVFLARHDTDGNQAWISQFGTSAYDGAESLLSDGAAGVFIAGRTAGSLGGPNAGDNDAYLARFGPACYPDLNADGSLDLFDFLAFVNLFNAEDPIADCDTDAAFTFFDFLCFSNAFNAGC